MKDKLGYENGVSWDREAWSYLNDVMGQTELTSQERPYPL